MTAKNCGKAIAPWLHHQVFKGQHMRGPSYDNLTQREFIYGCVAQLNNYNYKKDNESMLHYLRDLMDDSRDKHAKWLLIRNQYK